MTADDPLTAALEEIKERTENGSLAEVVADNRVVVAALEAALALHHRSDEPERTHHVCPEHVRQRVASRELRAWREAASTCPDCTVTERYVCAHERCRAECPDDDAWPCPTVRAITAELSGKEEGDGN